MIMMLTYISCPILGLNYLKPEMPVAASGWLPVQLNDLRLMSGLIWITGLISETSQLINADLILIQ